MKKSNLSLLALFAVILMFSAHSVKAQDRYVMNLQDYNNQPYHFGFILGFDQMLYSIKTIDNLSSVTWHGGNETADLNSDYYYRVKSINANGSPGFSVGILGNLLLNNYVDLRFIPSISFGSRTLVYRIQQSADGVFTGDKVFRVNKQMNSTYLIFPLLLKYRSWRSNNVGAYFIGGMSYSIDLAAVKRVGEASNISGIIKTRTHDAEVQLGTGFDFYTHYFKLGVEAKMLYGLNNLIYNEGDIYSGSIRQLHSKIFMLSLTFE
ncbi:MAG: PorT family protein [Bacteroidales bacterium]|nr:PorT family protein [Bacteroidales bacterium]